MFIRSIIFFYTFLITASSVFNFTDFGLFSLKAQEPPSILLSSYDTVMCPENTIYLDVSIAGQLPIKATYVTVVGGDSVFKTISSLTKPLKIEISKIGSYTISSYSNNNISVDTNISFNIKEVGKPNAILSGGGQFCANETITPIEVFFTGSPPWTLTYQNNFGNAIIQTFNNSTNILLDTVGIVNIRRLEDLHCRTELLDTHSITHFETPLAEISGANELCKFDGSTYSTIYNSEYKYKWIIPEAANSNIGEDFQANTLPLIWTQAGNFSLELIVETKNTGCTSGSIFFPVKINEFPIVLQDFDTVLCFDWENYLRINPSKVLENTIFWPHTGDTSQESDIYEPGTYTYIERIPFGCEATGNFRVIDKCIPELYVADAFSPNGDGINDQLEIKGVYFNLFISFYTSAGELVYTKAPNSPDWDGTVKGVSMPIGDYYWKAKFTDKIGGEFTEEGWVTLIR